MGEAWQRVASGTSADLACAAVDASGRVWVGASDGSLLRSDDGAVTFAAAAQAPGGSLAGVWSDGGSRIVACSGREIVASDDGGATWAVACRGKYNDNLRQSGGMLIATNIRSRVLTSTDGGRRWASVDTGCSRYLYSVAASGSGTVCAGSDEAIALSRDRGKSYRVLRLRHRQYLRGAWVTEAGEAVLVGDEGKVHLVDGAGRVGSAHLEKSLCLYDVWGRGDELFAAGHSAYAPAIRRSLDGGATWQAERLEAPGGARCLSAVVGLPGGTVVAVGEQGGIWARR